jgi:VanZ family protein
MIWTSSDTNIARVSSSGDRGLVTGIKEGIVTITAVSVLDENIVETIEVNVLKASTLSVTESRNLNIFIRKALGHVGLFFVNGIFGYLTIIYFIKKKKDHVLLFISLGIGAFLSSTAELLQFIPVGRGPMIEDVIMNFIGYFIANIVLFFGIKYYPRIKKKFEERKLKKENIKT